MLSAQDIQNKELTRAVFGGYDMAVVDDFLEVVAADYAALHKENAILKSKLKVLVEKVEEYRSTEDAMRMALLTAQKMGDDMLSESKQKSEEILANAENMAKQQLSELAQQIADEEARLQAAKKKTGDFVAAAKQISEKYNACLDNLDEISAEPIEAPVEEVKEVKSEEPQFEPEAESEPVTEPTPGKSEDEIVGTAMEIDKNVTELLRDDPTPAGVPEDNDEPTVVFRTKDTSVNWADDDEPTSPRPKFDFSDLQFGAKYNDNN